MNDKFVFRIEHLVAVLSFLSVTGFCTSLYFASLVGSMAESSMHLRDECISRETASAVLDVADRASRISNLCIEFNRTQRKNLEKSFPEVFSPARNYNQYGPYR